MVHYIDKSKKPNKVKFYLAKSDHKRTIISPLNDVMDEDLVYNFDEASSLSLTLPYYIDIAHKKTINPILDEVRLKYRIKAVDGDVVTWFVIHQKPTSYSDTNTISITASSLEYELIYSKVSSLDVTSVTINKLMEQVLQNTGWAIGYVNPTINLKFRSFDISSQTTLEFIREAAESYEAIVQFDTVKQTVNFYLEEEISPDRGFTIKDGQYLLSMDDNEDLGSITTRLTITGKDGLGINSVNPTGQPYLDDFTFFLTPFKRDKDRNVLEQSHYMSNALAHGILDYNESVKTNADSFKSLLEKIKLYQEDIVTSEIELSSLRTNARITQDRIVAHERGVELHDLTDLKSTFSKQSTDVDRKEAEIRTLKDLVKTAEEKVAQLRALLRYDSFMDQVTLQELNHFIHEEEWSDTNYFDPTDLYEAGFKELQEKSTPAVEINLNSVNFFAMISEQHMWDKVKLGDMITVFNSQLNTNIKARLTSLNPLHNSPSFSMTISNGKRKLSDGERFAQEVYSVPQIRTDYNKRKIDYERTAINYSLRNDQIPDTPLSPSLPQRHTTHVTNDDGSINLKFDWQYPENYDQPENNIDGFRVMIFASSTPTPYQFGSNMSGEGTLFVPREKRSHTFEGVPANKFYTVGVMAYRVVSAEISSELIVVSEITQPTQSVEVNAQELTARNAAVQETLSLEQPLSLLMSMSDIQEVSATDEGIEDLSAIQSDYTGLVEEVIYLPYRAEAVVGVQGRLNNSYHLVQEDEPLVPEYSMHWVIPSSGETKVWDGEKWNSIGATLGDKIDGVEKDINDRIDDERSKTDDQINDVEDHIDTLPTFPDLDLIKDDLLNKEKEISDKIEEVRESLDSDREQNREHAKEVLDNIADLIEKKEQLEQYIDKQVEDLIDLNDRLKDQIDNEINEKVADLTEKTEQIRENLSNSIGDLTGNLSDLLKRVAEHRDELDANNGSIKDINATLDVVSNQFSLVATELSNLDNVIQENKASIKLNEKAIEAKVEQIAFDELTNVVNEQGSAISMLPDQINLIVSEKEATLREDFNGKIDDNFSEFKETVASINIRANEIESSVRDTHLRIDEEVETLLESMSEITQTAESIGLHVSRIEDITTEHERTLNEQQAGIDILIDAIALKVEETDVREIITDSKEIVEFYKKFALIDITTDEIISSVGETNRKISDQGTEYNQKVSQVNQRVDGVQTNISSLTTITGEQGTKISQNEADISFLLDEISFTLKSKTFDDFKKTYEENYAGLHIGFGNITSEISEVRGELNDLNGDMDDQFSQVSEKFTKVDQTLDSITSTVSDFQKSANGSFTSIRSDITQLSNQITSRITQEQLTNAVNGRVPNTTYNNKMSEIDQTLEGITSTVSSTTAKIDNLEIGASNILVNSSGKQQRPLLGFDRHGSFTSMSLSYIDDYIRFTNTGSSNADRYYQLGSTNTSSTQGFENNQNYTLAFDALVSRTAEIRVFSNVNGTWVRDTFTIPSDNAWKRYAFTFKFRNNAQGKMIRIQINGDGNNTVTFLAKKFQLEKGDRATDWGLSTYDILNNFSEFETSISSIQQTASNITQSVSKIQSDITDINKDISSFDSKIEQEANRISLTISKREAGYVQSNLESHVRSYNTQIQALENSINARVTSNEVNNIVSNGEIYVRGTGANRSSNRVVRVNGSQVNSSGGRGLRLTVLNRSNLTTHSQATYDVYGSDSQRTALATALNNLNDSYIVILNSFDAHATNQNLINAIMNVGGSGTVFTTGGAMHRVPFALVGIPGIGKGAGIEIITTNSSTAPQAEISLKVVDGVPQGINSNVSAVSQKAEEALSEITIMKGSIESKVERTTVESWRNEDLKRITSAESRITQTENSISSRVTSNQMNTAISNSEKAIITQTTSSIDQLSDRITSTVSKVENGNHLVSVINQTSTSIKIQAKLLDLTIGSSDGALRFVGPDGEIVTELSGETGAFDQLHIGHVKSQSVMNYNYEDYTIYVNPTSGNDETGGNAWSNAKETVQAAIDSIPRYNDGRVVIEVFIDDGRGVIVDEPIIIDSFTGGGSIRLNFRNRNTQVTKPMLIRGNTNYVRIDDCTFNVKGESNAVNIDRSIYTHIERCNFFGNQDTLAGIYVTSGSTLSVKNLAMHEFHRCIEAERAHVTVEDCNGYGMYEGLCSYWNSTISVQGTAPGGRNYDKRTASGGRFFGSNSTHNGGSPSIPRSPLSTNIWYSTGFDNWSTVGGWRNLTGVQQGTWGNTGNHKGLFYFHQNMRRDVSGKRVRRVRVYLHRDSFGGNASKTNLIIRPHGHLSRPGSEPQFLNASHTVPFEWGEYKWVTLPTSFHQFFQNGSIGGIGIFTTSQNIRDYSILVNRARVLVTYE
ncbi:DUF7359 domain-containing protein [Bacillus sp. Marseille-P3800]|uniref:DUF7359 domain-containing protein n=1 Tax=Bacillus sp. Marseille-P3800 TaxID=2014782 RepID=UPI000C083F56|nr:hypothetical protein [Bacillus sp. Marseille-P3800]